jgi:hypothetical protein
MDLGGAVEVIEGSLGSGKSAVAHLKAIMHLKEGGVVATNYGFVDDWAYMLAGQKISVMLGLQDRMKYANSLYSRCFRIGNAESMYALSGDRGAKIKELCVGKMKKRREGYGLLVIDEAHKYFNSRDYRNNSGFVDFFANARKLGWRTIIITHCIENIDKQIRSYVEFQTRFRNLKHVKIPFTPFPVSPIHTFLSITRYAGLGAGAGTKYGTDINILDKWSASLYDTFEVFRPDSVLQDVRNQGKPPSLMRDKKTNDKRNSQKKQIPRKKVEERKYYEQVNPKSKYKCIW